MQINDIFEENTLESISERTRIPTETLEQLLARNFGAFQKVQALGFVSILEREYRADLSAFREECLAAYAGDQSPKSIVPERKERDDRFTQKPMIIDVEKVDYMRVIKPVVVLLIVAAIVYGAWATLASDRSEVEANRTGGEEVGFFASVAQRVRQQLNGDEAPAPSVEPNISTETAPVSETVSASNNTTAAAKEETNVSSDATSDRTERNTTHPPQTDDWTAINTQIANAPVVDTNHTTSEAAVATTASAQNDLAAQEAARQAEAKRQAQREAERQAQREAARQAAEAEAKRKAEEEAARQAAEAEAKKRAEEEARKKAEAEAKRKAEEEAARQAAEAEAKKRAEEEARKKAEAEAKRKAEEAKRKAAAQRGVVLIPHAKVWLGIVDLSTMKRKVLTTNKQVAFKNPNGRWLVATGHGRLGLKIGTRTLDLDDSKKHFLLIENGTVREIAHERFQQLNQSKVW
jgi:hypothetical protein